MEWLTLLTFIFEQVPLCTEELTVRRSLVYSAVGGNTNIKTEILGNYAVRGNTRMKVQFWAEKQCFYRNLLLSSSSITIQGA